MELKPCPFCGSIYITMKEHPYGSYLTPQFYLMCEHCGSQGPWSGSKNEVIKHWNTRVTNNDNDPRIQTKTPSR